ncbi:flagellar filament capping protein FliD [Arthrobacter mobilis]|uniref:Flagellar hook-associated protein 2 n=1 Tax=Arthrobacter mobilis TaxID=2724944 RepID=A0A7X6K4Y1_9MICC|nr:flagellar filament capping protein FliD [Arthrobacter mobilis]NKX53604.1 flagellar filament capping protein FliD [Arthrobacter mobilis]
MAFAIGGLASGLDTTTMISQLMQLEARPQVLLKNKVSATQSLVSSLQQLNTRVASLGSVAEKTAKPGALDLYKASSSSDKVTATAGAGAAAGSIDIKVDQVAQAQVSVSALLSDWPEDATTLTIALQDGRKIDVDSSGKTLDEVAAAVNAKDAGVTAMKVAAGADGSGIPQYRLQFSATGTGAAGSFGIQRTQAGTTVDMLTEPGAAQIRAAQDAEVTLWAGTAAARTLTSSTNTFTALLPGVDVTVSAASADPVTISVARDDAGLTKLAKDLVEGLAGLFFYIATNSAVSTSTASGTSTAKGGIFTGDSSVRDVQQNILRAASAPVDGRSPSETGISITRDGSVEFNAEKFAEALKEDPARTRKVLQEVASRVEVAAEDASDKHEGAVSLRIQGQESLVKELNTQVAEWDRRLELRQSTLERTWSALEVQLSALQSQGDWLSSQLATLPTYGGTKKS